MNKLCHTEVFAGTVLEQQKWRAFFFEKENHQNKLKCALKAVITDICFPAHDQGKFMHADYYTRCITIARIILTKMRAN